MKTIVIATALALATFASIGTAAAGINDPYTGGYQDWAKTALSGTVN